MNLTSQAKQVVGGGEQEKCTKESAYKLEKNKRPQPTSRPLPTAATTATTAIATTLTEVHTCTPLPSQSCHINLRQSPVRALHLRRSATKPTTTTMTATTLNADA